MPINWNEMKERLLKQAKSSANVIIVLGLLVATLFLVLPDSSFLANLGTTFFVYLGSITLVRALWDTGVWLKRVFSKARDEVSE